MKLSKKKDDKKTEAQKVQERREEVLSTGRKFKYPLQFTKHRIVTNTILISLVVVVLLVFGGWLALYKLQSTDEVLYRVSKVLPMAVANVDGEAVLFSDYLMIYRSALLSVERQSGKLGNDESATELKNQYRRSALTEAESYAYAMKLGEELGLSVSDEEITAEFERHRQVGGVDRSKESFLKVIEDNFGLSEAEYRRLLKLSLMKAKVETTIDATANQTAVAVEKLLVENGGNYLAVAEQLGGAVQYEETGGMVSSKNVDGGRATEAIKLNPGESSGKFVSLNGDGYYFVKLVDKNATEVNFVSIKIPFTEFAQRFAQLEADGKIQEYIEL